MTNLPEKELTKVITDNLQYRMNLGQLLWIKNHRFAGRITRRDGSQGFIKNTGAGSPDIIIALLDGKTIWLELKTKKGVLSPAQKKWRDKLTEMGHFYCVARDYNEFEKILKI